MKQSRLCIIILLEHIFNQSLSTGIIPGQMKSAVITPVHKQGCTEMMNNYRPFSLLPVFPKLLEKIVFKRVYRFIEENSLLYKSQYGFLMKKNCKLAIMDLCGNIFNSNSNIILVQKYLQEDVNILVDWFNANKLSINAKKTKLMTF